MQPMIRLSEIANISLGLPNSGWGMEEDYRGYAVRLVESGGLGDTCWLGLDNLKEVVVPSYEGVDRYLLRPYDVLVTARASTVQAALVPPAVSRTVASVTLLVVRAHDTGSGMEHFIWYFLTSRWGQAQLKRRVTVGATLTTLSAAGLGEVELPVPSRDVLQRIASLVEASENAYTLTLEAARLRREALRDSIIGTLESTSR